MTATPSAPPVVNLADDGHVPAPREMAARLAELTASGEVGADYYGDGGPVTALEAAFASLLGKEAAVMVSTGTLANLLGLKLLATGPGPRIIVHRDSHFFNDAGDNISAIGGITMVPLAGQGASFSPEAVEAEIARTASARVRSSLAAIAIESPSRRLDNRLFDPASRDAVVALAKSHAIPLHLDGARIFIEAAWTGRSVAEIAQPFDLVYVSLYKYLGAPFGSILAGPARLLEGLFHERRRQGGGLYQMWPAALLALDALPRQTQDWAAARRAGDAVLAALEADGLPVRRYADGTNTVRIPAGRAARTPEAAKAQTARSGLKLAPAQGSELVLKINPTWTADHPTAIAARLMALVA